MNDVLRGVERSSIIKIVAIYFVIYAILGACAGPLFALVGGFASFGAATGAALQSSGLSTVEGGQEAIDAMNTLATFGGMATIIAVLSLISVPVLLVAAYGLFQRTRWSRSAAIVALAFIIVLSLFTLSGGIINILWLLVSGFVLYLFLTDEGIKAELAG